MDEPVQDARGRNLRRVIVAAAGAAAVVATVLLAGPRSHPPPPLASVTSALTMTSASSYSFSLTSTVQIAGRQFDSDLVSGAVSPGHQLGTERLTTRIAGHTVTARIRFTGKYVYTCVSPRSGMLMLGTPWDKAPAQPLGADVLPGPDPYGFVSDQPVSPAILAGVLRSAASVREAGAASGPGWTGTRYLFTSRLSALEFVSGTIDLDQHGHVRRLVTITTRGRITTKRDLTLGSYGTPVTVTAPPASQVTYTSGRPYWGFYF